MAKRKIFRQIVNDKVFLVQEEPRGPSQLIEILVTQNGLGSFNLPDVPELRSSVETTVIVKAMRLIPPSVLTNGPTTGQPNAPLTELQKMSLKIYCEGWEKGKNIPILTLVDTFTEGSGIPWRDRTMQFANWENVDWNKTILQFSNGTVSAGQPYVIILEVEYVKFNQEGTEIIGPE